jgi:hypothetical protein
MKYLSVAGMTATFIYSSFLSILPVSAGEFWDRVGNYVNESGNKIAKVADITDRNSDARRILRNMDISNPNSPSCNVLRNGGDDTSAAAATAGSKGMAAAAAIQTAKKICGNAAQGKAINSDQAEIDMAVIYQTQLSIEQTKQSGDTERVRILEASKLKLEELQQNGETERTKIVQENLLAITLSNNQTQIALGEQNLRAIESNNWASIQRQKIQMWESIATTGIGVFGDIIRSGDRKSVDKDTNKTAIEIEKIRAEKEIKLKELELKQKELGEKNNSLQNKVTTIEDSSNRLRENLSISVSLVEDSVDYIQNSSTLDIVLPNITEMQEIKSIYRQYGLRPASCKENVAKLRIGSLFLCMQPTFMYEAGRVYKP